MESRILHGSSADASSLAPDLVGKVTLVVTSPPYHNAISYKDHAKSSKLDYRKRYSLDYANDYMKMLDAVWESCLEMLASGGHLAINVGSVLDNGYHYPLAEDITNQLTRFGKWEFIRTFFWNKVTAGVKRAGSVIQHPFPSYWHPNIMTESIMLFKKPGQRRIPDGDYPTEWNEPVWDLAPVPPRTINHPAPFPEDLPHRFIRMLTNPEDWVMDPFNGAGATTKASFDLGRSSIGFDIEKKYVQIAKNRFKEHTQVRDKQLSIHPVRAKEFIPGPSRGKTRQGSGKGSKR